SFHFLCKKQTLWQLRTRLFVLGICPILESEETFRDALIRTYQYFRQALVHHQNLLCLQGIPIQISGFSFFFLLTSHFLLLVSDLFYLYLELHISLYDGLRVWIKDGLG